MISMETPQSVSLNVKILSSLVGDKFGSRKVAPFTTDTKFIESGNARRRRRRRSNSWDHGMSTRTKKHGSNLPNFNRGSAVEYRYQHQWRNGVVLKSSSKSKKVRIKIWLHDGKYTHLKDNVRSLVPPTKILWFNRLLLDYSDFRASNIEFPSWIKVGADVWICHPSLNQYHGWMPGKIRFYVDGEKILISYLKTSDVYKKKWKSSKTSIALMMMNAANIQKMNHSEIICNTDFQVKKRNNIYNLNNWSSVWRHLQEQHTRDTLSHMVKSNEYGSIFKDFTAHELNNEAGIMAEILSYLEKIEESRLLYITPPTTCQNSKKQLVLKGDDCIMVKFVMNKCVEVAGLKIFNVEPDTKQHFRLVELFGIPLEKSDQSSKLYKLYNIESCEVYKQRQRGRRQKVGSQRRLSIPLGMEAMKGGLHKQLELSIHEHRDSDDSAGMFFRQPIVLMANALYCLRLRCTAFKSNKVFVNRWYPNPMDNKPIYNYQAGLFRSIQWDLPHYLHWVPHFALMQNVNERFLPLNL